MANDNSCVNLRTIDNVDVAKAEQGLGLAYSDKLECGHTLARQAFETIGPKSVRVENTSGWGRSWGSGFFVGKDGDEVVTNAHVINGSFKTTVETSSGEVFNARVIDEDEVNDLAHLKILGLAKDPSRSIAISDEKEIKSGTPMLGVGHPGGYHGAIVADGEAVAQGPWALLYSQDALAKAVEATAYYAATHPEYAKDTEKAFFAEKILMDTPLWHGGSGEPIVNDKNKLVGVGEALDPTSTFLGYAVPATKVSDLLNRKEKVFNFSYKSESEFDRDPIATSLTTVGLTAGAFFLRKYAAPILGLGDAPDAYKQLSTATRADLFAPRSDYIAAGLADLAGVAGGVMSLIPRTRMIGYGIVGAKLLYDDAKAFLPDTQVLQSVHRTNGDKRLPYQWDIFSKTP